MRHNRMWYWFAARVVRPHTVRYLAEQITSYSCKKRIHTSTYQTCLDTLHPAKTKSNRWLQNFAHNYSSIRFEHFCKAKTLTIENASILRVKIYSNSKTDHFVDFQIWQKKIDAKRLGRALARMLSSFRIIISSSHFLKVAAWCK